MNIKKENKIILNINGELQEIEIRDTTQKEHDESIKLMASFIGQQDNGKVGIFWFDLKSRSLFGIVAIDYKSISESYIQNGVITCNEEHYKVWHKRQETQILKNLKGPYIGEYKDTPRGRIYYNFATDTFEIRVGDWIDDNEDAIEEIVREFDLLNYKYLVIKDSQYNLGKE